VVPNLHYGAQRPPKAPSGKILSYAQVLANICIIVNFQLRSSIHAGLTKRSLYNRFCIERSPKMGFLGDFGAGAKICGGNPSRNAMTADLRRAAKKLLKLVRQQNAYLAIRPAMTNRCVSRTDTNPPFAFQTAFPLGTDFTVFLQGGSKSYIRCL